MVCSQTRDDLASETGTGNCPQCHPWPLIAEPQFFGSIVPP